MSGKSKVPCEGCRDDFYNEPGHSADGECWMLKSAKLVIRWRIGTWVMPETIRAFQEVRCYSCRHEQGFALYDKLPDFAVLPRKLMK